MTQLFDILYKGVRTEVDTAKSDISTNTTAVATNATDIGNRVVKAEGIGEALTGTSLETSPIEPAPVPGQVILYSLDNGGMQELNVVFGNGVRKVLAVETP
jgi:archaellum component FlaF (FlaF/FlaG flagellin family)